MRKYFLPFFLMMSTAICSCGQKTFDEKAAGMLKNTVPVIHALELSQLKDSVILLDTRTPEEFKISHLNDARFVNYNQFKAEDVNNIPKDAAIVVYCTIGYRSERIGEQLQDMGFTHVQNLYGGIFDWKNNNQQVVNMAGKPTDSVHTYNKSWSKWLFKGTKIYD